MKIKNTFLNKIIASLILGLIITSILALFMFRDIPNFSFKLVDLLGISLIFTAFSIFWTFTGFLDGIIFVSKSEQIINESIEFNKVKDEYSEELFTNNRIPFELAKELRKILNNEIKFTSYSFKIYSLEGEEVVTKNKILILYLKQYNKDFARNIEKLELKYRVKFYKFEPDTLDCFVLTSILDKFDIVEAIETIGNDYDISNKQILERLKYWDNKYGVNLKGIAQDWIEFEFQNSPKEYEIDKLVGEIVELCPDTMEQGYNSKEAIAEAIKNKEPIFLWWD